MKSKKNKYIVISIAIVIITIAVIVISSYALWQINKSQTDENLLIVGSDSCVKTSFVDGKQIELVNTFPITDEEGSLKDPYNFEMRNECGRHYVYEVHLEILNNTTMDASNIKFKLNDSDPVLLNSYATTATTLENAVTAYKLDEGFLLKDETIAYDVRMWLKNDAVHDDVASKEINSKIVIVSREITSTDTDKSYAYTGQMQTFVPVVAGNYQIELWGAQGGSSTNGKGAYTKGTIALSTTDEIYIYVGQKGINFDTSCSSAGTLSWNGGGAATAYSSISCGARGGGATDVRLTKASSTVTTWNNSASLRSRIMVAAGGGGGYSTHAGNGGTLTGADATVADSIYATAQGKGAKQTTGGAAPTRYSACAVNTNTNGTAGTFGIGGTGGKSSSDGSTGTGGAGGSGGGGGYYGGSASSAGCAARWSGGGGSSYVSGCSGCNSVTQSGGTTAQPTHSGSNIHYSGRTFTSITMTAGSNTGNGRAQITFIS